MDVPIGPQEPGPHVDDKANSRDPQWVSCVEYAVDQDLWLHEIIKFLQIPEQRGYIVAVEDLQFVRNRRCRRCDSAQPEPGSEEFTLARAPPENPQRSRREPTARPRPREPPYRA